MQDPVKYYLSSSMVEIFQDDQIFHYFSPISGSLRCIKSPSETSVQMQMLRYLELAETQPSLTLKCFKYIGLDP